MANAGCEPGKRTTCVSLRIWRKGGKKKEDALIVLYTLVSPMDFCLPLHGKLYPNSPVGTYSSGSLAISVLYVTGSENEA